MATKDWNKTALTNTLVRFQNKKSGSIVFAIPTIRDRVNGKWDLHLPDGRIIDYRGKREVKKAMKAYMRSH